MLHEEVEKYVKLSGDKEAWQNTPIIRIGSYLDGYDRGLEVLDKISTEIKALSPEPTAYDVVDGNPIKDAVWEIIADVLKIIDKYKGEGEV